jgi:hypothetical protein
MDGAPMGTASNDLKQTSWEMPMYSNNIGKPRTQQVLIWGWHNTSLIRAYDRDLREYKTFCM